MNKIGIITCANATQDLDCCCVSCLRDLAKRKGTFSRYTEQEDVRLTGIVSCSGCPTLAYPEKILRKVRSLAEFGVTHLHFSYCMVALCPYLTKYKEVISRVHPNINLIEGTHEVHLPYEGFREKVQCALKLNQKMSDIILEKI